VTVLQEVILFHSFTLSLFLINLILKQIYVIVYVKLIKGIAMTLIINNSCFNELVIPDPDLNNKESLNKDIPKIIDVLYELSSKNADLTTTRKTELFGKINKLYLKILKYNDRYDASICDLVISKFEKRGIGETQRLAKWIAKNSQRIEVIEGAYKPLHDIFKFIAHHKGYRGNPSVFDLSHPDIMKEQPALTALQWIDFSAQLYVEENITNAAKNVPPLNEDLIRLICSMSKNKELRLVSKDYNKAVNSL